MPGLTTSTALQPHLDTGSRILLLWLHNDRYTVQTGQVYGRIHPT